ncbi:MAG: DUF5716 family protein [Lachnospiraceae bacterium]|nr:DUF5716 family protein [Lachnospiraceae bacterium]
MFFDKINIRNKLNSQSIVVGYDLGEEFSQISIVHLNGEEPITLSTIAGEEQFNIPTVLCKRNEVNQWFYGREAYRNGENGEGILIDHLIEKAKTGEMITVEEVQIEPVELLALYMKKSFSMLGMVTTMNNVAAIMITVDRLDARMVEVLTKATEYLNLKKDTVLFQSHEESAFYYIMNQPEELRSFQTGICDFTQGYLKTYCLEVNKHTVPMVSYVEEKIYEDARAQEDEKFLSIAMDLCRERIVSAVFLVGEKFQGEWYKRSISYLCNGRRVFQGNNLYSKGACYAIQERVKPSSLSQEYVFLGKDKLKSNIGIQVEHAGEDRYYGLLDAGENWYDTKAEVDFLMDSGNVVSLLISSLHDNENKKADMPLSGMPIRPRKTTRIHMEVQMTGENILQVHCQDMGFGEIYPSSGQQWTSSFEI